MDVIKKPQLISEMKSLKTESYLSLGSNVGNKENYIVSAIKKIKEIKEIKVLKISNYYITKALEVVDQDDFINTIVKIETSFDPNELLLKLKNIEMKLGRKFRYLKGPREIDIDILLFGKRELSLKNLKIPHHSIFTRPFIKQILIDMNEWNLFNEYLKKS